MRAIDLHAHLTPQCFQREVLAGKTWHGMTRAEGELFNPMNAWTPEQRLADMNSLGVDIQVVSTNVAFYKYDQDVTTTTAIAQACNNEVHQMTVDYPERFAGLATLPMQDIKAAIAELERAVGQLGLKGAMINDQVNGRTFDEPDFLPFWTAVFGGVMDACPNLNICLAHGGGYTCFGIGRMDRGWQVRSEARGHITQPPSAYLSRFYYDCLTHSEAALRLVIDTVGADRVVLGTDWPADMRIDWPVAWVLGLQSLTQEEKELILWKNLERLLGL